MVLVSKCLLFRVGDLSRGKSAAVAKDLSIGLVCALCVNFARLRLEVGMLSMCVKFST